MSNSDSSIPPVSFLSNLRRVYPQFDQRQPSTDFHVQQDAEECYTQLLRSLSDQLPPLSGDESKNFISQLFNGTLLQKLKNTEDETQKEEVKTESFSKLACHIDNETRFLMNGLKRGLEEIIEKNSPITGQLTQYKQTSRIKDLPYYLTVQFVRFYWKKNVKVGKEMQGVKVKPISSFITEPFYQT